MIDELIARLVNRLGINSGDKYATTDPAKEQVIAALLGRTETSVSVIDVPYEGYRYIVLSSLNDPESFGYRHPRVPALVRTHLHREGDKCDCGATSRFKQLGWLGRESQLTSWEVAQWFLGRANGVGEKESQAMPPSWAPAADDSFAPVTIGGDLGKVRQVTHDVAWEGNRYRWYDLDDTPIGGSVYRQSATDTLWVFTRRDEHFWEATIITDVDWAHTPRRDGESEKNFGTLYEGALEFYRLMEE